MQDYFYFQVKGIVQPIGYVHISVVRAISWPIYWVIDWDIRTLTLTEGTNPLERSQLMKDTLWKASVEGSVPRLRRWHNEVGPVYASNNEYVMEMDVSGTGIFGVLSYGVMLTGWITESQQRKYWVPRRSKSKVSHPGMLDNFVSGTLRANERPIDCMVREVFEETGLPEEYVRRRLVPCGTVTYHMTKDSDGTPSVQPHVQYVYEIETEPPQKPIPNDGEVECFYLMTVDEVRNALANEEFKPNTGMTWLAHFIRHGYVNSENQDNLVEINSRLHRKHDFFIV